MGKDVKKLEFKIVKTFSKTPSYHIIIARKRSSTNSRLDKIGYFHFSKKYHPGFFKEHNIKLLGINFKKMKKYILQGATFHKRVIRILNA